MPTVHTSVVKWRLWHQHGCECMCVYVCVCVQMYVLIRKINTHTCTPIVMSVTMCVKCQSAQKKYFRNQLIAMECRQCGGASVTMVVACPEWAGWPASQQCCRMSAAGNGWINEWRFSTNLTMNENANDQTNETHHKCSESRVSECERTSVCVCLCSQRIIGKVSEQRILWKWFHCRCSGSQLWL